MHATYRFLDALNEGVGRVLAWFTLAMVLVQFVVVLMRYVFSAPDFLWISTIWWQELIVYMHGTLIMLGIGYTLLHNGHVRVDIFYREAPPIVKDWTDFLGSLLFLLPMCWIMWWSAWPNVANSWRMLEGSTETSGIPYKYLLKSTVVVGAALLALQALSTALKAFLRIAGDVVDDPYGDEQGMG
ncbi:MAG TPA: TRAP transporter small permease subunit [Thermohalobaculum sp.]|nr:TRAP transporter small permease subunit [Thermohalobaculum sp.]